MPENRLPTLYSILKSLIRVVFCGRIRVNEMSGAVVRRIFAMSLPNRLAFDVRSLALIALDKLHLFSASTCILYKEPSTHCTPEQFQTVRMTFVKVDYNS